MYDILENIDMLKETIKELRGNLGGKNESFKFKDAETFNYKESIDNLIEYYRGIEYNKGFCSAYRLFIENYVKPFELNEWEEFSGKIKNVEKLMIAKTIEEAFNKGLNQGKKHRESEIEELKRNSVFVKYRPKTTCFFIEKGCVKKGIVFSVVVRDKVEYEIIEAEDCYKIKLKEDELFSSIEEALEYIEMEKE